MSQAQPARAGDVYPLPAADQEARRERNRVITRGQEQHEGGLHVTETDISAGKRMVTASAGGQVMAQFTVPVPDKKVAEATDGATVGEALQAAGQTAAGDEPVGLADASAVQVAEMRATGRGGTIPGGVAAAAQRAAEANKAKQPAAEEEGEVTRLRDVVGDATAVMPADKVATREDAEKVAAAARRKAGAASGGGEDIVEAVAATADMNQGRKM
uniref:Late embryogenesis abundant n=1 Tax=Cleistogenes songorica TaxID=121774 RepID=A0A2S1WLU2_9POAL|nr:late embryogenesis abundant [Cleistogenes songorica]